MTWFYNNLGEAHGPHDDTTMMSLVAAGNIDTRTLIWHNGLNVWQEAGTLSPAWWQAPEIKPAITPDAKSTEMTPARRSPVPLAPTQATVKKESEGFLKRLFGGKKKPI